MKHPIMVYLKVLGLACVGIKLISEIMDLSPDTGAWLCTFLVLYKDTRWTISQNMRAKDILGDINAFMKDNEGKGVEQ